MKERLKQAVNDGIILGVKYGIVLFILGWVAQDYMHARSNALYGKAAQEWILAGIQAGKLPAEWHSAAQPAPQASPAVGMAPQAPTPLPVPVASPVRVK